MVPLIELREKGSKWWSYASLKQNEYQEWIYEVTGFGWNFHSTGIVYQVFMPGHSANDQIAPGTEGKNTWLGIGKVRPIVVCGMTTSVFKCVYLYICYNKYLFKMCILLIWAISSFFKRNLFWWEKEDIPGIWWSMWFFIFTSWS